MIESGIVVKSKVSVVIPLHDKETTIGRTLDSILAYPSVGDVVVVDDASTDNSARIVDEYCRTDARVRLHRREFKNVSMARNLGYELAEGDLVCFLDADDYWVGDVATVMKQLAEHYPGVEVFGVGHRVVSGRERINLKPVQLSVLGLIGRPELVSYQDYWIVPKSLRICSSTVAFRKPRMRLPSLFNPRLKFGEDLDLWIRASRYGKTCVCPAALVEIDRTDSTTHVYGSAPPEAWNLLSESLRESFESERKRVHFWDRKMAHELARAIRQFKLPLAWWFFCRLSLPFQLFLPIHLSLKALRRVGLGLATASHEKS
ncbi:glycosyltransferase family 2 protein [Frateuria soli]|uniref:glycosyltransferase family 2 protein n=1 Tax=Frateuria soli TaxID=1542730 RepID=UPI003CCD137E